MINKLINHLSEKQNTLFLIDALGAILTSFFMFIIMRQFNEYFGMPKSVLTYLGGIAFCFCVYSTSCFLFLRGQWPLFIRIISISNLLYCAFTIGALVNSYTLLTQIGLIYFLTEIVIILLLCYVELKVARKIKYGNIDH
ncbi:hypothetical protein [Lacihabitans soyangensis]|uniref:hypothetical protein n=1 Tax=Lacihabitans soyangensis TaxID=869394 RepID=UPI0020CF261A|nr:hypothetical protein [Lacihabitans soyangensis]